jgi:HD-like signal output (HDOD) protein
MHSSIEQLGNEIVEAIKDDKITLPTLPEVALAIRDVAADPDVSVGALAAVICRDAGLSARLIKVVNSPIYRARNPIQDVTMAVGRMGVKFTSNLVTGLAMQQMFQATNAVVDAQMREVWAKSAEVAGICQVLCRHYTKLSPDQATLAGLVHKIGALPILRYTEEKHTSLLKNRDTLTLAINQLHPVVGKLILEAWDFPPELSMVPEEHLNFHRSVDVVDYADLVMVANLQSYLSSDSDCSGEGWESISAFQRVGLEPEVNVYNAEELSAEREEATELLA